MVLLAALSGCAHNYGTLQKSAAVNQLFVNCQILRGHHYYFAGPEGRPDAIMAIHEDYMLQSTQWTAIHFTEKTLQDWIDKIHFHHRNRTRYYPYGFDILAPTGVTIGVWYSIWNWTTVMVGPDNRVWVYPPTDSDPYVDGGDRRQLKDSY